MCAQPTVLIVDDDPDHLRIYGWIVEAAGYRAIKAEVRYQGFNLPNEHADLVLLDYNLGGQTTAAQIAKTIHEGSPDVPILLLSDRWEVPDDVAPFVQELVRKGDPSKLVQRIRQQLQTA